MDQTGTKIKVEVEKYSLDDFLPPEMLLEILKHVDSKSLFSCRLVNQSWRQFGTEVCQSRSDLELRFDSIHFFEKGSKLMTAKRRRKTSLEAFTLKFGSSSELVKFPYAHFRFDQVNHSTLCSSEWNNFLCDFGENQKINCLKLGATNICDAEGLMKLTEKLSDLLLNQVPNLQEFGLQFGEYSFKNSTSQEIQLFSTSTTSSGKAQLPHLKVLYLSESMLTSYTGIATDLLRASLNLVKIEPFANKKLPFDRYNSIDSFITLQSLGKLHCLQDAQIELLPRILPKIQKIQVQDKLEFKLKTLSLLKGAPFKTARDWQLVTIFLSNLFESCKDSLRELTMDSLGFISQLQFPKFSKLGHLHILQTYYGKPPGFFLPSGVEFAHVFPALRSLDLRNPWSTVFPPGDSDSGSACLTVTAVPTLSSIKIVGSGMSGSSIAQMAARCPNLKKLVIEGGVLENFPQVGTAIWTHFRGLESLELLVDVHTKANAFPAIDSCITGFSREDCFHLYNLMSARAAAKTKVPQSELKLNLQEMKRTNPSILNLKDLKHFKIHLASYYSTCNGSGRLFMSKVMTSISEDGALKLMENLKYEIIGKY